MDSGLSSNLLGKSVFSKYRRNPWYESVHSGMLSLYLVFLLTFFLGFSVDSIHCLPQNGTLADEFSVAEANYISGQCQDSAHHGDPHERIQIFILVIMFYLALVDRMYSTSLAPAFSAFSEAQEMFAKISVGASRKSFFDQFLEDPEAHELREIVRFLQEKIYKSAETHQRRCSLHYHYEISDRTIRALHSRHLFHTSFLLFYSVFFIAFFPGISTDFVCDVEYEFRWSSNATTKYTCVRPWARNHNVIAAFYVCVINTHFLVHVWGCLKIFRKSNKETPNGNIKSARCCLLLVSFGNYSSYDEVRFDDFVKSLMSQKSQRHFTRIISSIGGGTDSLLCKFCPNSESERPDASQLASNTLWKWVIYLLEREFPEVDSAELLSDASQDEDGNSLLYYALNREPGKDFNLRAARKILQYNDVVMHGGVKMTASEFIVKQYLEDRTYPERLKEHLSQVRKNITGTPENGESESEACDHSQVTARLLDV